MLYNARSAWGRGRPDDLRARDHPGRDRRGQLRLQAAVQQGKWDRRKWDRRKWDRRVISSAAPSYGADGRSEARAGNRWEGKR